MGEGSLTWVDGLVSRLFPAYGGAEASVFRVLGVYGICGFDWRWFNVSSPMWLRWVPRWWVGWDRRKIWTFRLWNAFNRVTAVEHCWGFGILQINSLHLLFISDSKLALFFFTIVDYEWE